MKKKDKKEIENKATPLTEKQKEEVKIILGLVSGLFSKALLKAGGCEVDFKINGEDISDIKQLHRLDITQRIELAVKQERYEDAAKLKKLLETKPIEGKKNYPTTHTTHHCVRVLLAQVHILPRQKSKRLKEAVCLFR